VDEVRGRGLLGERDLGGEHAMGGDGLVSEVASAAKSTRMTAPEPMIPGRLPRTMLEWQDSPRWAGAAESVIVTRYAPHTVTVRRTAARQLPYSDWWTIVPKRSAITTIGSTNDRPAARMTSPTITGSNGSVRRANSVVTNTAMSSTSATRPSAWSVAGRLGSTPIGSCESGPLQANTIAAARTRCSTDLGKRFRTRVMHAR
jgi:hypothetical protein